jgi:hypothetical protein
MRIELETLALRQSIAKGDVTWEANLVAAHHRLNVTPTHFEDGRGNLDWLTAHGGFHAALAAAAGSPILERLRRQLYDAAELYRMWSRPPRSRRTQSRRRTFRGQRGGRLRHRRRGHRGGGMGLPGAPRASATCPHAAAGPSRRRSCSTPAVDCGLGGRALRACRTRVREHGDHRTMRRDQKLPPVCVVAAVAASG